MNSNADWKLYEEYRDLLFRINRDLMLNCRRLCGPGSGENLVCFRPKKFVFPSNVVRQALTSYGT